MAYVGKLPSGKWRAVYRDRSGRRHSITRPTKREAEIEAAEREIEVRRGVWVDPELTHVKFSVWLDRWKRTRVVVENTERKNASHLKNHVLPRWKDSPLDGIERLDVQEWVASMQRAKVGPATIQAAVGVFGAALQAAVDHGLIRVNPAHGLRLPEVPVQPFRILDEDEVALIESRLGPADALMVRLDYVLGLRWGEIAGLHGHRVTFGSRPVVQVVEVLTRHDGIKDYPKSKLGRRDLPVPSGLAERLAEHLLDRPAQGLVFAASTGPLDYTNWRRRVWLDAVAGLPAPLPTFHDLRHSCASNLISDGVDVATVQRFMGHESLRTTQRYAHATEAGQERLRAVLEARDSPGTHARQLSELETGPTRL